MSNKNLKAIMESKGMKISTWAKSQGLSKKDIEILQNLSLGRIKGKWGRSKELKNLLIKNSFLTA